MNKKKTLYLSLKSKWYKMIESGEKTEEYRELKDYWHKRFRGKVFDYVRFSYGYTKRTMTFRVECITTGTGKPEWGAPDGTAYIIRLGERVSGDE